MKKKAQELYNKSVNNRLASLLSNKKNTNKVCSNTKKMFPYSPVSKLDNESLTTQNRICATNLQDKLLTLYSEMVRESQEQGWDFFQQDYIYQKDLYSNFHVMMFDFIDYKQHDDLEDESDEEEEY